MGASFEAHNFNDPATLSSQPTRSVRRASGFVQVGIPYK